MEEFDMFDECRLELTEVGCALEEKAGYWTITFPDGERKTFSDVDFKLILYRVYNEVMA